MNSQFGTYRAAAALSLTPSTLAAMRAALPDIARDAVDHITANVPEYRVTFAGQLGAAIAGAVELALVNFLRLAHSGTDADPAVPIAESTAAAYDLGRGEARSGRSIDALLAAYRIGARASWRGLSQSALASGLDSETMATFAELVFAYIDELSAASVVGHTAELEHTGRERARHREQLADLLLRGGDPTAVTYAATRAGWREPEQIVVAFIPEQQLTIVRPRLPESTLYASRSCDGLPDGCSAAIIPIASPADRQFVLRSLVGRGAVLSQAGSLHHTSACRLRAQRVWDAHPRHGLDTIDCDAVLPWLVVTADLTALTDLQAQALAPLASCSPSQRDKLLDTLRAWLMLQGRRDDMAQALFIHPQTVRYRVNQLRDAFGEALNDPATIIALTIATMADTPTDTSATHRTAALKGHTPASEDHRHRTR